MMTISLDFQFCLILSTFSVLQLALNHAHTDTSELFMNQSFERAYLCLSFASLMSVLACLPCDWLLFACPGVS